MYRSLRGSSGDILKHSEPRNICLYNSLLPSHVKKRASCENRRLLIAHVTRLLTALIPIHVPKGDIFSAFHVTGRFLVSLASQ